MWSIMCLRVSGGGACSQSPELSNYEWYLKPFCHPQDKVQLLVFLAEEAEFGPNSIFSFSSPASSLPSTLCPGHKQPFAVAQRAHDLVHF